MCGIYLSVTKSDAESTDPADVPPSPSWLIRRGPDHQGRARLCCCCPHRSVSSNTEKHEDEVEDQNGYDDIQKKKIQVATVATATATLQASILNMRREFMAQPVEVIEENITNINCDNCDSDKGSGSSSSYLAWNGEIYQMLPLPLPLPPPETQETTPSLWCDVDDASISDTRLVTELLRPILLHVAAAAAVGAADGDTDDDAVDKSLKLLLQQQLAQHVCARLVNAEFAFCLLTDTTVYYGRDVWGRRSLLVNDGQQQQQPGGWQLASVATTTEVGSWQEVVPGVVHAYQWTTGITFPAVPWDTPRPLLTMKFASTTTTTTTIATTPLPSSLEQGSLELQELLTRAVQRRLGLTSNTTTSSTTSHTTTSSSSSSTHNVAVLFSGGLDSVVVAALALRVLPTTHTLTLLTVSFVDDDNDDDDHDDEDCDVATASTTESAAADTRAARASYQELRQLFPHHNILLRHQRVPWTAVARHEAHIRALIYPKTTVMDLNIATALWFAARILTTATATTSSSSSSSTSTQQPQYTHHPRILLTGLGADELLGGYKRHGQAWRCGGAAALQQELHRDQQRLWERNLGRDDRILSDHGVEVRLPFLDPHVVHYCQDHLRAEHLLVMDADQNHNHNNDPAPPHLPGDKRVLRRVAQRLGLTTAAAAPKRAIQFGSRVAHVSDKRRFGSRRQATGTATCREQQQPP